MTDFTTRPPPRQGEKRRISVLLCPKCKRRCNTRVYKKSKRFLQGPFLQQGKFFIGSFHIFPEYLKGECSCRSAAGKNSPRSQRRSSRMPKPRRAGKGKSAAALASLSRAGRKEPDARGEFPLVKLKLPFLPAFCQLLQENSRYPCVSTEPNRPEATSEALRRASSCKCA